MKNKIILIIFSAIFVNVYSQTPDNLDEKITSTQVSAFKADHFAIARPFNINFTQQSPFSFTSKNKETGEITKNKINSSSQLKSNVNVNYIRRTQWNITGTFGYSYTKSNLDNENFNTNIIDSKNVSSHYIFTSTNFNYISRLFNKNIFYNANLIIDGYEKDFERVKFLAGATLLLKADSKTKMGVGIVVLIDAASPLPFIPTFIYERKFENGWTADFILPQRLFMRKDINSKGRLYLGTEINANLLYLTAGKDSEMYEFRQAELNTGATYEHLLGKQFILTTKAGFRHVVASNIFEKGNSSNDYLFDIKNDASLYINIGISFNPFINQ